MSMKNTRMTIVLVAFALILSLSFIDNGTATVAIGSVGAITMTFITGKSFTDGRNALIQKQDNEPNLRI